MSLYNVNVWHDNNRINVNKLTSSYDEHGDALVTFEQPSYISTLPLLWDRPVYLEHPVYGYYWLGYLAVPAFDKNSDCVQYTVRGMYKSADHVKFSSKSVFRAGSPAIEMVRTALSKCERIFDAYPSLLNDITFQLVEDSPSFGLDTAAAVFQYVQQLTDYLATPLEWEVLQNPTLALGTPAPTLSMHAKDIAVRYRCRLRKKDEFKATFDVDTVANVGLVRWGTDQFQAATNYGYSAPELPDTPAIPLEIPKIDYSIIPHRRDKILNVSGTVNNIREVQNLAGYLVNNNNKLMPVAQATIYDQTTIESIYPQIISDNLPHMLVRSNIGIEFLNDLSSWGFYNITTFYILGAKYDYDKCALELQLGLPALSDSFRLLGSYDVSREYIGAQSAVINLVHRDADVLVQYGTEFDGRTGQQAINPDDATMLNNFSVGVVQAIGTTDSQTGDPRFNDKNSPFYQPTGQSVNPNIIPDYGTQANFGREADSIGIKGFVKLIPQKATEWEIAFIAPAGSDTIPTQSIEIEFYETYPFIPGVETPFATKSCVNKQHDNGSFTGTELHIFPQGGKVGIRVKQIGTTALGTGTPVAGSMFQVTITGRKLYPDLGINS